MGNGQPMAGFEPAMTRSSNIDAGSVSRHRKWATIWVRKSPAACVVMTMEMVETHAEQSGWFDWLEHDKSLVPETSEGLVGTPVGGLQLNGRLLDLKPATGMCDFTAGERRTL